MEKQNLNKAENPELDISDVMLSNTHNFIVLYKKLTTNQTDKN